jgi:hypothetical protein
MRSATFTLLVLIGLSLASIAGASNYDESVNGDLSGIRLAPTVISLGAGSNTITATSVAGDLEYYTVTVPVGFELSAITLVSYVSLDNLAFVAVQNGTVFTEPPTGTNVAQLLGWTHFGPGNSTVGTDILDNMGAGAGAIGFTPPLGAGNYVFWSQQTGLNASTYSLDLQITAAPAVPGLSGGGVLLLCVGLGLMLVTLRRCGLAYGAGLRD